MPRETCSCAKLGQITAILVEALAELCKMFTVRTQHIRCNVVNDNWNCGFVQPKRLRSIRNRNIAVVQRPSQDVIYHSEHWRLHINPRNATSEQNFAVAPINTVSHKQFSLVLPRKTERRTTSRVF
jgi:hypothetical protein